jgi:hypothetical protein
MRCSVCARDIGNDCSAASSHASSVALTFIPCRALLNTKISAGVLAATDFMLTTSCNAELCR